MSKRGRRVRWAVRHPMLALRRAIALVIARLARAAADAEAWQRAVLLWRATAFVEAQPSARSLLQLGKTLTAAGDSEAAAAVLHAAMRRHPDNVHMATNWAQAATEARQWLEAADRWREVAEGRSDAPPRAWARWADALRRSGRPGAGLDVVSEAVERHGIASGALAVAEARCRDQLGDADGAAGVWSRLLAVAPDVVPPAGFRSLANWHRLDGRTGDGLVVLDQGLIQYPTDASLRWLRAELLMVERDWEQALHAWAAFLAVAPEGARIPHGRAGTDWHAGAWVRVVHWLQDASHLPRPLHGEQTVRTVAEAIGRVDPGIAVALLDRVAEETPLSAEAQTARERFLRMAERRHVGARSRADARTGRLESAVVDALADTGPASVARLVVVAGSEVETAAQSGRYVDLDQVRDWLDESGSLTLPPEDRRASDIEDDVAAQVDEVARSLAAGMEVPEETLREALYLPLWQLGLTRRALEDLAEELAADGDGPVFLPSPYTLRVFDPLDLTSGWQLLLAAALSTRGVPTVLVHAHARDAPRTPPPLRVGVGRSLLVGREPQRAPPPDMRQDVVFPAGVRSLVDVLQRIEQPLICSGDAIVSAFAYDRTLSSVVDYRPEVSVLPDTETLEPVEIVSRRGGGRVRRTLDPRPLVAGPVPRSPEQLARLLLGPPLQDMMERSRALVGHYRIERAHVADHLYPGASIVAGAVREAGGSVSLWPHSTNPVHERVRRAGSFDEVRTVLSSGSERWHREHPGVAVKEAPSLMLRWADEPAAVDPDGPVEVVVIGGTSVLGLTPFVDPEHHRTAYRDLFSGLRKLANAGEARIWFKPKGGQAEGLWWLEQVLGDSDWIEAMRQHPRRIDRPNLVYVSVSLGSSAIWEGIARGVPGLVVRQQPVEDYTTISDSAIPVVTPGEALQVLAGCRTAAGRETLLGHELDQMAAELGQPAPWMTSALEGTP